MMTAKYFDLTTFQVLFLSKWVFFQITFYSSDQALKRYVTISRPTPGLNPALTQVKVQIVKILEALVGYCLIIKKNC